MLRVYVSGPYTSSPDENTRKAIQVGQQLLETGLFAPMVPHLTHYWHELHQNDYRAWLDLDLAWVEVADVVYRMRGDSAGADEEIALALHRGIPVYDNKELLIRDVKDGKIKQQSQSAGIPAPVAAALDRIRATFAKKNADYAEDKAAWSSNFEDVARQMAWETPQEAAEALIAVKQARLRSMRSNGRPPLNEAVDDTILDRAVYSVIALALLMEEAESHSC